MLDHGTTRDEVPNWDSFAYVNFIAVVEMRARGKFSVAEVEAFETWAHIVRRIRELTDDSTAHHRGRASMLFNSYEFILVFLPVTVLGFFMLGRVSQYWSLRWLISLRCSSTPGGARSTYSSSRLHFIINFFLARTSSAWSSARAEAATAVLVLGIAFNVAFLGYFKYATSP